MSQDSTAGESENSLDAFAIAEHEIRGGENTEPIAPRTLPRRVLRDDGNGARFEGLRGRMASGREFDEDLQKWRDWARPWLRNLTPPRRNEQPKRRLYLGEFAFRYEEPEDRYRPERALSGDGNWEQVRIPHYQGPIGRWHAYYRSEILASDIPEGDRIVLRFDGVDYTAEVHLNGVYIGSHEGFFAPFEFDVTDTILRDRTNVLVLRIGNDLPPLGSNNHYRWETPGATREKQEGTKIYAATGLSWDNPHGGWQHCPPGAGVWRPVCFESRPELSITDVFVRPLPLDGVAEIWLDLHSARDTRQSLNISLSGEVHPRNFEAVEGEGLPATSGPVKPEPARYGLNHYRIRVPIERPRWWAPKTPYLYTARISVEHEGAIVDSTDVAFGIRTFRLIEAPDRHGLRGSLELNGKPVILRGANTMGFEQQDVQKEDYEQLIDDILIAKMCHLNFLRITQRPVQREVYEYMDALGLMNQCDFPAFGFMRRGKSSEIVKQAGEMEKHVRRHPGVIMVSFINEPFPYAWRQDRHRNYFRYELEHIFDAMRAAVLLENPDRVVKSCDGDYDPPTRWGLPDLHMYSLWHPGHGRPFGEIYKGYLPPVKRNWKLGSGEFGAEGMDRWELAKRHYPESWLPQSPSEPWNPKRIPSSQAEDWHRFWFDPGWNYETWYENVNSYQQWANQALIEAFRRRSDRIVSTALHLLIDSFPTNWMKCIVDFERRPKAAYFTVREALTPVAVNVRCDHRFVFAGAHIAPEYYLLNDTSEPVDDLRMEWFVIDAAKHVTLSGGRQVGAPATWPEFLGTLAWTAPEVDERTRYQFVAVLKDDTGRILHDHVLHIEVFPRPCGLSGEGLSSEGEARAVVLGQSNGPARRYVEGMGLVPVEYSEMDPEKLREIGLVVCDSPDILKANAREVFGCVEDGGGLLLLGQQQPAVWELPHQEVKVSRLGPREFTSRATGHPIVKDFEPRDFFMLYDPDLDAPGVITSYGLYPDDQEAVEPILQSGLGGFHHSGEDAPAACSLTHGKGRIVVNEFALSDRVRVVPIAYHYGGNILKYLRTRM